MHQDAIKIFQAGVHAVQPQHLLPHNIRLGSGTLSLGNQTFSLSQIQNLYVVGAGKASAAMARETEKILGDAITAGLVVTKYDHSLPLQHIRCLEAGHPVPDENGLQAGREIVQLLSQAGEKDLVLALISGGASALMVDCPPHVTLNDLQQVFTMLLASGADILEMNTVRKHLSPGIKGGQLTRSAYPATLVSLVLSDVPGDPLESIASGPTVSDPSTFTDAWKVLEKYKLTKRLPAGVSAWLQDGAAGNVPDTPKPGDPVFRQSHTQLIGSNRIALEAAEAMAEKMSYHAQIVTDQLSGEASEQAARIVQHAMQYAGPRPACLLWGGETTVTIRGSGKGGRNQELALAVLNALRKKDLSSGAFPVVLCAGTDGTDGPTDAAGAVVHHEILQMVEKKHLDIDRFLLQNDSYHFFQESGGHVITGPTQTNVMDLVVYLIP